MSTMAEANPCSEIGKLYNIEQIKNDFMLCESIHKCTICPDFLG